MIKEIIILFGMINKERNRRFERRIMERLTVRFDNNYIPRKLCIIARDREIDDIDGCIEYCAHCQGECSKCAIQECFNKLAEYEDLEEQGLLLRLPCKVGDTVYTPCAWGIESGIVGSIEIISDRIFVNNIHGEMIGEINTVFLMRAEAEKALRKMNEREDKSDE